MCGRIACALGVEDLSCATSCKSKDGNVYVKTKAHQSTNQSQPSYNVPPTASVPVLVSAEHKCFRNSNIEPNTNLSEETDTDRLLVSMRFGIIPHWLKADGVKSYNHETHLCKIERMRESKLYNPLFEKGYRCAIPCVGYYEWQTTKSASKQPYFFYNKNNSPSDLISKKGSFKSDCGWEGIDLLYLAGIFSIYTNSEGNEAYSFAIITRETNEDWQWVHHRMPVVLQSDDDVQNWIKCGTSPPGTVFEILETPITNLEAHPVDKTIVNKTKNHFSSCIEPIDLNKPANKFMMSWLVGKKVSDSNKNLEEKKPDNKQTKKRSSLDSWLTSVPKKSKDD